MNIKQIIKQAKWFMEATEQEVLHKFKALPGCQELPYDNGPNGDPFNKNRPSLFIPGTRKDRVLLVAHYDTVWWTNKSAKSPLGERLIDVAQSGYMLYSADPTVGIGADNRLGCSLLWSLRRLGHSILLVPDEEIGCRGSGSVASQYPEVLKDHQFMMQFDRRGSSDLVYYRYENSAFNTFLMTNFPGYSKAFGSCTDIVKLVPAAGVHGVNVSIGFNSEHQSKEWVDMLDYIRTGTYTKTLLKQENLPSFPYVAPVVKPYIVDTTKKATKKVTNTSAPVVSTTETKHNEKKKKMWDKMGKKAEAKITSWSKKPTPAETILPTTTKLLTPSTLGTITGPSTLEPLTRDLPGNEVDGYGAKATLEGQNIALITAPDGSEIRVILSPQLAQTLVDQPLRDTKAELFHIDDLPCTTCRSQVAPSLQIHGMDGTIICAGCKTRLLEPMESLRAAVTKANEELLVLAREGTGQ